MRPRLPALVGLAVFGVSGAASGLEADVQADTAMQAYSLRSPWGDPILMRRRVTQTIGLGVYSLLPDEKPGGPQLFVKLRMRLDVDAGIEEQERSLSSDRRDSRYVPGLREAPLDLMYGYVEGRNLAGGWLGFRLGRQYVTDALGWWSFDGGMVRLTAPFVHAEVYGGWEQRGGMPLSTGRFEQNGVWRGARSPVLDGSPELYTPYLEQSMAPAFGFALESAGPHWIHGRLDYRRVLNTGTVTGSPFARYPDAQRAAFTTVSGKRISSERLGYAVDGTFKEYAGAKAGLVYDFYNGLLSSYYLSLDGYLGRRVTVSADYDHFKPTFDGDSIFNWFTHSAIDTATLRTSVVVTPHVDVAASGGVRMWATDDDPTTAQLPNVTLSGYNVSDPEASSKHTLTDVLGSVHGRYRRERTRGQLRGVLETGERGQRKGVDVSGEQGFFSGKYLAEGRLSLFDWKDDLRPDRSATSFGYVVGGGFRPGPYADVLVEWEHNMNRIVGQRYRVLALINVRTTK